jgi:hypothetical protein
MTVPWAQIGPTGLLTILVLLILIGRLVPRRTLEDVLHDRDEWRAAHRISEAARVESARQVEELLEHARTTDEIIRALPLAGQRLQDQGHKG